MATNDPNHPHGGTSHLPLPSRSTTTRNPPTSPSITSPRPAYHPQTPIRNLLNPTLTNIHTNGTIVLPYDDATHQSTPKPNTLNESLHACVRYCCLPRAPPSDWSSDYSSTPYPSSLSSYTDSYSLTESVRSREPIRDAEPVQVENLKTKKKDVGYAKQEGMSSTRDAGCESSSQQCCRRC